MSKRFAVVVQNDENYIPVGNNLNTNPRRCYETNSLPRALSTAELLASVNAGCEVHVMETVHVFVSPTVKPVMKSYNKNGELVPQ